MKRVLIYLGMSSTAASKMKTISTGRAISRPDFPETDAPVYKSVVAVAEPFPNDETVSTGTRDEAFFDSETWLESDCDDFFSVQGDKTPSLNASPVHPKKTDNTPSLNVSPVHPKKTEKTPSLNASPVHLKETDKTPTLNASPVHPKKTLRELLSESFDSRKYIDPQIFIDEKQEEELPNAAYKLQRRKSSRSARHCFPSLVRSLSCSEWKKKRLSPVHIVHC